MARKSSTIHIEESFWHEISDYMETNKINSRNAAIEQMLIERRLLLKVLNHNTTPQINPTPIAAQPTEAIEPKNEIDSMIDDPFDMMD